MSIIACALTLLATPSLASGLAPTTAQGGIELLLGADAQRNSPVPLEGQVVEGDVHIVRPIPTSERWQLEWIGAAWWRRRAGDGIAKIRAVISS